METKKTNKNVLIKGIKKIGVTVILMFLGPTLIYISFSNQERVLFIPLLLLGIISCCSAIYLAYRGINTILDSMFKN